MPTINIDSRPNSPIISITVNEINGSFLLEINCSDTESAKDLQGTIGALKKIYEADTDSQNFILRKFTPITSISVIGNIFNALNILREKEVIDKSVFAIVDANQEFQTILQSSKTFTLTSSSNVGFFNSENKSTDSALSANESRIITDLETQISQLSDNAREVLMRDLQEKYKVSTEKLLPKKIGAK
ncbi:MAG: hypothetical protein V4501_06705 [Pseudomonadota bacterium]